VVVMVVVVVVIVVYLKLPSHVSIAASEMKDVTVYSIYKLCALHLYFISIKLSRILQNSVFQSREVTAEFRFTI
jgi:predicted membrane channel-forming protein YqfA (hemolysin III family)